MSPEQVKGQDIDLRSDIYSSGVLLFNMLAGKLPYNITTASEFEIMKSIVEQDLPAIPNSDSKINEIIKKATTKNPEARYQSAKEFSEALEVLFVSEQPQLQPQAPPIQPAIQKKQTPRSIFVLLTVILGLAMILLFAYSINSHQKALNWMDKYYDKEAELENQITDYDSETRDLQKESKKKDLEIRELKQQLIQTQTSAANMAKKLAPIQIRTIEFVNVDYYGNTISTYGSAFKQNQIRYIRPRISFNSQVECGRNINFYAKYIEPNGQVMQGNNSPSGYTFYNDYYVSPDQRNSTMELVGWGNNTKSIYSSGTYKVEIWYNEALIAFDSFNVK